MSRKVVSGFIVVISFNAQTARRGANSPAQIVWIVTSPARCKHWTGTIYFGLDSLSFIWLIWEPGYPVVHPRRRIKTCCHTQCPLQAKSDIYCLQMTKKTISRSPSSIQNFILLFYLISRRRHFFAFIIYHVISSSFRSRSLNNNLNMRSSLVESKCTGNELKCKQFMYTMDLKIHTDNIYLENNL